MKHKERPYENTLVYPIDFHKEVDKIRACK